MTNKRPKPEEIITKLRQVEVLMGQGMAHVVQSGLWIERDTAVEPASPLVTQSVSVLGTTVPKQHFKSKLCILLGIKLALLLPDVGGPHEDHR